MIAIRPARAADIAPIARAMRPMDRLECEAFGHDPRTALRQGLRGGEAFTCCAADGRPLGMLGVVAASLVEGVGRPWLLCGEALVADVRAWAVLGPPTMDRLGRGFLRLENLVHRDNAASIRWLKRLGFTFAAGTEDVGGQPFVRFSRHV